MVQKKELEKLVKDNKGKRDKALIFAEIDGQYDQEYFQGDIDHLLYLISEMIYQFCKKTNIPYNDLDNIIWDYYRAKKEKERAKK